MMPGISALQLSNPYLGYRLDPGEPGMLRSAKATDSAIAVTGQERRNLARLVSQAYMEGRIPIRTSITYEVGYAGSFMAVKAGHTTVESMPVNNRQFLEPITQPPSTLWTSFEPGGGYAAATAQNEEAPGAGNNQGAEAAAPQIQETPEDLARTEREMQADLATALRDRDVARANQKDSATDFQAQRAVAEQKDADSRIQKIQRELSKINFERITKEMEKYQKQASNVLVQNAQTPFDLIRAAAGGQNRAAANRAPLNIVA